MSLSLHAAGSVAFTAGAPAWLWQSGAFTATIADAGDGDVSLNLAADKGVDATESVIIVTAREAQTASALTSFGVVHTSDVAKQVTIVQEDGGGAASRRRDVNFDVMVLVRNLV